MGDIMKKMVFDMALGAALTVGVLKCMQTKEVKKMKHKISKIML